MLPISSPLTGRKGSAHMLSTVGRHPPDSPRDGRDLEESQEASRLLKATGPPPPVDPVSMRGLTKAFEGDTVAHKAAQLLVCFVGLQVSYILWGILQEKVMTQPYGDISAPEYFPSSTFLVFSNRLLALAIAAVMVYNPRSDPRQRTLKASLLEFAPSSLSNILSSWAQYEALKYVSFPTQVLSKSSKIIPVMLVGKLVQRKSYSWAEYGEAALITMGVGIFSLNEKKPKAGHGGQDSALGILLLAMYLTCDSFTSQWQDKVYKKHQVSQFQMMLGINTCSIVLTGLSLLQSGQGLESVQFMMRHPGAGTHIMWLSVSSSLGQLFIFYTIKRFGPIVFTIIMTIRQMLSMVISCMLFGHPLAWRSAIGAMLCFGTIGYRVRRNMTRRKSGGAGKAQQVRSEGPNGAGN